MLYKHVAHAVPRDPSYQFIAPARVHPLHWASNYVYSDMHKFARVVVEVPTNTATAQVTARKPEEVVQPPRWLLYYRAAAVAAPTAVLVGAVDQIGPIGPIVAGVWLGLNWWLY